MGKGKAIASMVLGILSIVFTVFGVVPLVMGIVAITLSGFSLSREKDGRGLAITGLVTGIIGTISSAFYALFWAAIVSTAVSI